MHQLIKESSMRRYSLTVLTTFLLFIIAGHRHSGIRHLSSVPDQSGTGLGLLIPVVDWFRQHPFSMPAPDLPDAERSSIPAFKDNEIKYDRLRAENDMLDVVRRSEIVGYELRMTAERCQELRDGWPEF
jgi:hypothetical protein